MTIAEVEKLMEVVKTKNPIKIIEYVETLLEVAYELGVTAEIAKIDVSF